VTEKQSNPEQVSPAVTPPVPQGLWHYHPEIQEDAEATGFSGMAPEEVATCRRFGWPAAILAVPVAAFFLYMLVGAFLAVAKMTLHVLVAIKDSIL
jgi:hypothetical protein